nr:hypothetical protein [Tanacetum cinerariifolium]
TKFAKQPIAKILPKIGETKALSKPVTSDSVYKPQVSKGVNNDKVIAPGMFRINPNKVFREAKKVPNTVSASSRTKPIIVSQPSVITKKSMNSNSNGLSLTGLDNTKTRRPQPRSNTKNDRVPSASKSSRSMNKEVKVEEHHRNLLLFKKNKHSSSACNNSKIDSQDVKSKVVCAKCKKYLNSVNHDVCLNNCVNGKKSYGRKYKANVSKNETQKEYRPKVSKSRDIFPDHVDSVSLPDRVKSGDVVAIASAQKNRGTLAVLGIVRAASTSVWFCLSTMSFCLGVRATDVWSFVDTRFCSMLNINPIKIRASYEVELADGSMDWLCMYDAIIVCGKKVVHIPYENKMLTVESDKGVSRLEVISCIKARLPSLRPVEFQIDLVLRAIHVARAQYRLAPSEMR